MVMATSAGSPPPGVGEGLADTEAPLGVGEGEAPDGVAEPDRDAVSVVVVPPPVGEGVTVDVAV